MFYSIFINPFVNLIESVYLVLNSIIKDYGISLLLLSIVTSIVINLLNKLFAVFPKRETQIQQILLPQISVIKSESTGLERHNRIKNLYKRYSYSPLYSFRSIIPFLIQLPFLLAAYFMLSNLKEIEGVSFLIINDLSKPDHLLFGINMLPIIMTLVNVFTALISSQLSKKERIQAIFIALLFLILLYNSPSALLIFWTINNVLSLIRTLSLQKSCCEKDWMPRLWQLVFKGNGVNSKSYLVMILLSIYLLIVIYLIPLQLIVFYGENIDIDIAFFHKISFGLVIFFWLFILLIILLTNYIFIKFHKTKFYKILTLILVFAISWVTLSGYLFPVVKTVGGMVESYQLSTNFLNLFFVVIISIIVTVLFNIKKCRYITKILFIVFYSITIPINFIYLNKYFENIQKIKDERIFNISAKRNLFVISFDGIPGNVVNDIINNEKIFNIYFKDFIYFQNVISSSPATVASMATELFGNKDMKKIAVDQDRLIKKLPLNRLLMNMKIDSNICISTYGAYNTFVIDKERIVRNIADQKSIQKVGNLLNLYESELSRFFSGKISKYFKPIISNATQLLDDNNIMGISYFHHYGPAWDLPNLYQKNDFNSFVENLKVSDDTLVIKYLHFSHTHFPVDFDKKGIYRSNDKDWYESNQNYKGLYNQTYFALCQFYNLIKRLKELGIYDNSFIVLKSDHGEPAFYFDQYPYNLIINNNTAWGYNRYLPMLMIKNERHQSDSLKKNYKLVTLGDLDKTISLRFIMNKSDSQSYEGIDLLGEVDLTKSPKFYLEVCKNRESNFKFDTQISIELDRSISGSLLELLKMNKAVILSEPK